MKNFILLMNPVYGRAEALSVAASADTREELEDLLKTEKSPAAWRDDKGYSKIYRKDGSLERFNHIDESLPYGGGVLFVGPMTQEEIQDCEQVASARLENVTHRVIYKLIQNIKELNCRLQAERDLSDELACTLRNIDASEQLLPHEKELLDKHATMRKGGG